MSWWASRGFGRDSGDGTWPGSHLAAPPAHSVPGTWAHRAAPQARGCRWHSQGHPSRATCTSWAITWPEAQSVMGAAGGFSVSPEPAPPSPRGAPPGPEHPGRGQEGGGLLQEAPGGVGQRRQAWARVFLRVWWPPCHTTRAPGCPPLPASLPTAGTRSWSPCPACTLPFLLSTPYMPSPSLAWHLRLSSCCRSSLVSPPSHHWPPKEPG